MLPSGDRNWQLISVDVLISVSICLISSKTFSPLLNIDFISCFHYKTLEFYWNWLDNILSPYTTIDETIIRTVQYLTGENIKFVWAEFSILIHAVSHYFLSWKLNQGTLTIDLLINRIRNGWSSKISYWPGA